LITIRLLWGVGGGEIFDDDEVLIPRITFLTELPSEYTLRRQQFPLAPAYATTFNSCQGMTLATLGIDLTRDVFSHGQLYTALSRIRHRDDARVRLQPGQSSTINVTYEELL
jgi:ATP-dependent exoDNAse (exonuclease V) alpha subunit